MPTIDDEGFFYVATFGRGEDKSKDIDMWFHPLRGVFSYRNDNELDNDLLEELSPTLEKAFLKSMNEVLKKKEKFNTVEIETRRQKQKEKNERRIASINKSKNVKLD